MIIRYHTRGVGSWKISLAIWIDPDAWMWLFDDEDASRDATKKARQIYLFSIYLILRFLVDNTFLLLQDHHNIFSSTPRPCSIGVVVSFAIILLLCRQESLRRSPREETVHTATISTAEKGHHCRSVLKAKTKQIWHGAATSHCWPLS